ncbi:hypothetical protein [Oceanithermus desulfurans]
MDQAHTSPAASPQLAAESRRARFRDRFPIGPGYELKRRFGYQALDAVLAVGLGLLMWLQLQSLPFFAVGAVLLMLLGLDDLQGGVRLRRAPTWLLVADELCLKGRCLPLDRVDRVALEAYRPYMLRIDRLPVLRLVLEGRGVRWAVPLTHENWERLWERLQQRRPGMLDWRRHPVLLRAFAQEREVPYHLPAGVIADDLGLPGWARALQLGLGGGLLLLGWLPSPALQAVPGELWFGLAGAAVLLVERKTRRIRVEVTTRRSGAGGGS